jgi:hypothetical protein
MHEAVRRFISEHEKKAKEQGNYRSQLGVLEIAFLEGVWGPAFQYNFDGLYAEYPLKDFKGGERFVDFVYVKDGIKLLMELDGYTAHAREISPGDFDDHKTRQNDLVLSGWMVLRFSGNQVRRKTQTCQRQIFQAIGHWWILVHTGLDGRPADIWEYRKRRVVQLALSNGGRVRNSQVAKEFDIVNRTANKWMVRFVEMGAFEPVSKGKRITQYRLLGQESNREIS